ncbi:zinc-finger double domain-containing protein [Ditylenchus destructor]|nr:zinc-finger double domain-containing protein [Ditylenchus destructor]
MRRVIYHLTALDVPSKISYHPAGTYHGFFEIQVREVRDFGQNPGCAKKTFYAPHRWGRVIYHLTALDVPSKTSYDSAGTYPGFFEIQASFIFASSTDEMATNLFFCKECRMGFDDHSDVQRHVSITHFDFFPYKCLTCRAKGIRHETLSSELMQEHTSTAHAGREPDVRFSTTEENNLKTAVERCRRPTAEQTSPIDSKNIVRQVFISEGTALPNIGTGVTDDVTTSTKMKRAVEFEVAANDNSVTLNNEGPTSIQPNNGSSRYYESTLELNLRENAEEIDSIIPPVSSTEPTAAVCAQQNVADLIPSSESTSDLSAIVSTKVESVKNVSTVPVGLRLEAALSSYVPIDVDANESQHNSVETTIRAAAQNSSNDSVAKLIQRKRSVPINDCNKQMQTTSKRSNGKPKKTNSTEMPYKCDRCSFASAHKSTHTGEKPYKCEQCSYVSANKGTLEIHMRIHTGEKPFKCNHCSYASVQKSMLDRHTRTHTGEKPFKCNQCSYACAHKSALRIHTRTHTGEKPFKCNQCSYACTTGSDLTIHMRNHSGEKPYKCSECPFAGVSASSLLKHVRSRHSK